MSLTDIMSAMKLHHYAEVALILFLAAFIAVVFYVMSKKNRDRFDKARFMPLDDDTPQEPREGRDAEGGKAGSDEDDSDRAKMSVTPVTLCREAS